MEERTVEVPTADGPMTSFITHPDTGGPFPAVVIYMDIWGPREELYDIARRVGTVGYYAVVPNFYHRQGNISFEYRDDQGRMMSLRELDAETQKRVLDPLSKLTNGMVMADTAGLIDFIRAGEPARADAMGSIGYCMGGRHALCAAGRFPSSFVATASLHGTSMISEDEDSPHLLADRFVGKIYCGYGSLDPYTPPELVDSMAEVMAASGADYQYVVHEGVSHGYALPDRDIFDKHAANRDWERIFAMFHRQIPAYTS